MADPNRVPVLNKGWIELQSVMGDDNAIIAAARTSFLGESKGHEKDKRLLFYLMRKQHTSPFEMVEFKFRLRAPVIVLWQWVRHRTWNYNLESARYHEMEPDFYVPDVWRGQSMSNKQASDGVIESQTLDTSLETHYSVSYKLYCTALEKGVAREIARLFLPGFALYYTGVAKVDAHNLMHFLKLRMAPEAQYEIRQYALAIYEHFFKPSLPWTAEAFEEYVLNA